VSPTDRATSSLLRILHPILHPIPQPKFSAMSRSGQFKSSSEMRVPPDHLVPKIGCTHFQRRSGTSLGLAQMNKTPHFGGHHVVHRRPCPLPLVGGRVTKLGTCKSQLSHFKGAVQHARIARYIFGRANQVDPWSPTPQASLPRRCILQVIFFEQRQPTLHSDLREEQKRCIRLPLHEYRTSFP
jgi:hypothetical protein